MFKNCVFRADVNTVQWARAAARRAVKTIAQTAVATIGTAAFMGEVNWAMVGSAALLAGLLSLLTSVAGLPELKNTAMGGNQIAGGDPPSPGAGLSA